MNQRPSQFLLCLSCSQLVASRICGFGLPVRGASATSAIGLSYKKIGAGSPLPAPRHLLAIDALQLPLGFGDGALGVLGAGAVVGEHVDHDEVRDRLRRLFADRSDPGGWQRAL